MKESEIHEIAKEYGVTLWFGYWLEAKYNGKTSDLMRTPSAYHKSWGYWHATFRELVKSPLAHYWTSTSQQKDAVLQQAYAETPRCVTRRAQG